MSETWSLIFNFADYGTLLALLRNSILAGAVLGLVGGLVGVFVMQRDMPFAVHAVSEVSFSGAAAGLLFGIGVVRGAVLGALITALAIGILGARARARNAAIAVLQPFGLGLGILFLSLYRGRAANKFGLLTGQIVAVDDPKLGQLAAIGAVSLAILFTIWRPLRFASLDPEVAEARGVPSGLLSLVFMVALGLATAVSVQIVGSLLVLSILCTPAAAAMRVTSGAVSVPVISVVVAEVAMVGGILVALGASVPISPYVTTIAFLEWAACAGIGRLRCRRERRPAAGRL